MACTQRVYLRKRAGGRIPDGTSFEAWGGSPGRALLGGRRADSRIAVGLADQKHGTAGLGGSEEMAVD